MPEVQFYFMELLEKQVIAPSINQLRFKKPAGFTFAAGQFVQCKITLPEGEYLRSYSISSTPDAPYLELCIKYLPGGKASNYFDTLAVGEKALLSGPRGRFVVSNTSFPKYFIATGTGMAPVMPMVETAEAVDVLFGVRTEADIFWLDRLQKVRERTVPCTTRITLSKPEESWTGLRGRVIEHLQIVPDGEYYVCGSVEMVKDVRTALLEKGVNTKSIHFEIF